MESPQTQHFISASKKAPKWASTINKLLCYLMYDLFGGPHLCRGTTVIDISSIIQIALFPIAMFYYQNDSITAWLFLVMIFNHEVIWLLKGRICPDATWENKATIAGGIFFFFALSVYWVLPWMLVSGYAQPSYPLSNNAWYALSLMVHFVGCLFLAVADVQKNFTLRYRKGLITDGIFRYIRHPNYLGQILIYVGFALMVWHWISTLIIACYVLFVFLTNMIMKEASMSRHEGWAEYKKKSWWLLPGIF